MGVGEVGPRGPDQRVVVIGLEQHTARALQASFARWRFLLLHGHSMTARPRRVEELTNDRTNLEYICYIVRTPALRIQT